MAILPSLLRSCSYLVCSSCFCVSACFADHLKPALPGFRRRSACSAKRGPKPRELLPKPGPRSRETKPTSPIVCSSVLCSETRRQACNTALDSLLQSACSIRASAFACMCAHVPVPPYCLAVAVPIAPMQARAHACVRRLSVVTDRHRYSRRQCQRASITEASTNRGRDPFDRFSKRQGHAESHRRAQHRGSLSGSGDILPQTQILEAQPWQSRESS